MYNQDNKKSDGDDIMKKTLALILSLIMIFAFFTACAKKPTDKETESAAPSVPSVTQDDVDKDIDYDKPVYIEMTVKDMGTFKLELYHEYAPETVENFVKLCLSGFYEGTKFHRVADNFMAQGGAAAHGETVKPIKGEFSSNGFEQNTLKHERGTISMARIPGDPDSATSQFFICYRDLESLDGDYAAFGKVVEGMDVIDSFLTVERTENAIGEMATPTKDIVIESVKYIALNKTDGDNNG